MDQNQNNGEWKIYDNSKDALAAIMQQFGAVGLLEVNYFNDFAPNLSMGTRKLVNSVYNSGAAQVLKNNLNSAQQEKEWAVKNAIQKMTDDNIDPSRAESIINEFAEVLSWKINKPMQNTSTLKLPNSGVIERILNKTDQLHVEDMFNSIVINRIALDKNHNLRTEAFDKVTDPVVFNQIALDKKDELRKKAFDKVTDSFVLNQIALDKYDELRKKAFDKVTDSFVFNQIALDKKDELRKKAFDKVTDSFVLNQIALDKNDNLHAEALKRLS